MLSVVIPSYNEEQMVQITVDKIKEILKNADINHEFIFVDDGSDDSTWAKIQDLSSADQSVKGVRFSRNFGKEAAIMAGLSFASGDCCVVIDCDLQHPPEKIVEMYRLWEDGYEIVEGIKTDRGREGAAHGFAAKRFYSIISAVTGFDMANASDFKLLDRKAVNVLINMREKNAFFRAMSAWIGFKSTRVNFEVQERVNGESKWSTEKLTKYAVRNITSFSTVPMQVVTFLGIVMLIVSVVMGGIALIQKISGAALEGFTTVIILQLFSGSIIMISIGIVGYYIARIFEEVKDRPLYIISNTCGGEEK